jgi:hypothetical protein
MKTLLVFLFLATALVGSKTAHAEIMVTITSSFEDQRTLFGKKLIKGSGFLVSAYNKQFVITASHVGSGSNPVISLNGVELQIIGQLYEGKRDVMIFEVQCQISSSMTLKDGVIFWEPERNHRLKYVDQSNFVLLNSWVEDPNLNIDNKYALKRKDALNCDFFCVLLQSSAILQPGSSGSPLLSRIEEKDWADKEADFPYDARERLPQNLWGKTILRGISIKRDRFFSRSFFIPSLEVVKVINKYVKNNLRSSAEPAFVWQISGSLMYRYKYFDFYESSLAAHHSGNGVSMDGGELSLYNEETPLKTLNVASSFPWYSGIKVFSWYFYFYKGEGVYQLGPMWFSMEHYAAFHEDDGMLEMMADMGFTFELGKNNLFDIFKRSMSAVGKKLADGSVEYQGLRTTAKGLEVTFETNEKKTIHFLVSNELACGVETEEKFCHYTFPSITEVKDSAGQDYILDLRELMFMNPEAMTTNYAKKRRKYDLSAKGLKQLNLSAVQEVMKIKKIRYRKKRPVVTPMSVEEGMGNTIEWKF